MSKLFCPRWTKDGMLNNPYWYSNEFNAGSKGDSALPNCVTYCIGRLNEITNQNMRNIMKNRTGFGNAKEWYSQTKLEKGSTPRLGAIACFDGTLGHVAMVEQINEDGTVTVSQSNYQSRKDYNSSNYFQIRTYKLEVGKVSSGVGLKFLGYIYPPNTRYAVERNTKLDQVEILAERIRARKTPNGAWNEGIFAPMGIFNIQEVQTAGDYTWAKLDDECWVALNDKDGWTKTYLKEVEVDISKDYKKLQEDYETLKSLYETALGDIKSLQADWRAINLENVKVCADLKQANEELEIVKNDYSMLKATLDKVKELVNG